MRPHPERLTFPVDIYRPTMHSDTVKPFQEPTFLILAALADGEHYGYGIIQEVGSLSKGAVRLGPGTLYGALDRLVEQGLVAADGEEVVDGRLRRYYRLSDDGAAVLEAEARRLADNAEAAAERLRRRARPRPRTVHG